MPWFRPAGDDRGYLLFSLLFTSVGDNRRRARVESSHEARPFAWGSKDLL
jgi:hypothetical protein